MTDHRSRLLERAARQGLDPASEAAHLAARLRAGTLTLERLELAAYCGSEAARGALGLGAAGEDCRDCGGTGNEHHACCDPECCPEGPGDECGTCVGRGVVAPEPPALAAWLSGLSRWADVGPVPGWVLVRASVAAARVALPKYMADAHGLGINAHGRLYEIDPGEWTSRAALNEAMLPVVLAPLRAIEAAEAWLDDPTEEHREACRAVPFSAPSFAAHAAHLVGFGYPHEDVHIRACVEDAARLAGETPVRAAICASLTEWALS